MRYPHLATKLYGTPLLIHPDKAAVIEAVFRAHALGDSAEPAADVHVPAPAAAAYAAPRYADKPYTLTEGRVAVIPVMGSLVQRASGLDAMSGLTSYLRLERLVRSAQADPDVRGILLELDTPGGEGAGVFALANQIAQAGKPVWAAANEIAYSAGYAIAAGAARIALPATAMLGSIGVIAMHVDQSQRDAKAGYLYTPIYAGARKADGNPHQPLTDAARTRLQLMVDELYGHFVAHVAARRSLSPEAVRATEAGIFTASEALAARLADAVQPFNDTLAEFEAHVAAPGRSSFSTGGASRPSTKGLAMQDQDTQAGGQTAAPAPDLGAVRAQAAADERSRIKAIQTCDEAAGRAQLAQHLAFATAMPVDEARALLAAAPKEAAAAAQANPLAAAMAAIGNPSVGADQPAAETDDAGALAARVVSFAPRSARK